MVFGLEFINYFGYFFRLGYFCNENFTRGLIFYCSGGCVKILEGTFFNNELKQGTKTSYDEDGELFCLDSSNNGFETTEFLHDKNIVGKTRATTF